MTKGERQMLTQTKNIWRNRAKEFTDAMLVANPVDMPRYEGIATAFRWCAEDLERLLTEKRYDQHRGNQ
jgi:hypothetical protein